MASEILAVPEQYLADFCDLVMAGLDSGKWHSSMVDGLTEWVEASREYMRGREDDG